MIILYSDKRTKFVFLVSKIHYGKLGQRNKEIAKIVKQDKL